MSTNIYVAYENPTHDPHIAGPVLEALFRSGLGHARPKVRPITNPHLHGVRQLLDHVVPIARRWTPLGYVAFVADLDGQDGSPGSGDRRAAFQRRLGELPTEARESSAVILGVQEVEVWALWGARTDLPDPWDVVRTELHPKETYFDALLTKEDALSKGGGRRRLVADSLRSGWPSLCQGCPELAEAERELRSRGW